MGSIRREPSAAYGDFPGIKNLGYALDGAGAYRVPRARAARSQPVASDAAPATPAFTLAFPTAVTPAATSVAAPTIEEKANEDEASPSAAEKLAAEMTEHGIDACEHGRTAAGCAASSADVASCRASMASLPAGSWNGRRFRKRSPNGSP